ncbi:MAG: hypothetical protein KGD64_03465 [Candidatus Heimdallarchaeota archaeon]|nr:hypothetical protein [Candidatus Heimdallarchaeota archaeon]
METHRHTYYFDSKDENQIVIYSRESIDCLDDLVIEGEVIEVRGETKRPTKIDDVTYVEYHILVDKWVCRK